MHEACDVKDTKNSPSMKHVAAAIQYTINSKAITLTFCRVTQNLTEVGVRFWSRCGRCSVTPIEAEQIVRNDMWSNEALVNTELNYMTFRPLKGSFEVSPIHTMPSTFVIEKQF
jgi:hypothetical protein